MSLRTLCDRDIWLSTMWYFTMVKMSIVFFRWIWNYLNQFSEDVYLRLCVSKFLNVQTEPEFQAISCSSISVKSILKVMSFSSTIYNAIEITVMQKHDSQYFQIHYYSSVIVIMLLRLLQFDCAFASLLILFTWPLVVPVPLMSLLFCLWI